MNVSAAPPNIVNVGYNSTNYYVVEQDGTRLLVDAGWPGTLPKLLHNLGRKGVSIENISLLLITHYHPDHAGLAQDLKARGLRHLVLTPQLAHIPELRSHVKPGSGYVEINPKTSLIFTESESKGVLQSLGIRGEILSTPGHSDDSVSLVLDGGAAFTGDLTRLETSPLTEASWAKLRAYGATTVYPGHGPAFWM